ncbi:MAG TPA: DUF4292 domain-containing protein [Bacteroidales bacterium]|nr:DUF4292 domain-containing protein [Bacteroidales bacterium]HQP03546.1 DUF4292 domain-containing protein [Bacteroidales bacterium]
MRGKTLVKLVLLIVPLFLGVGCSKVFYTGGIKNNYKPVKLFQKISESEIQYHTFMLKADCEFEVNGQSQSFQLNARIQKDSVVWLSMKMLGVEGMRVQCLKDSLYIVDRINNQWSVAAYKDLNNVFSMELCYQFIQAVITNTFFFYPPTSDTLKTLHDFDNCKDTLNYCMSSGGWKRYQRYISDSTGSRRNENRPGRYNPERYHDNEQEAGEASIFQVIKVYPEIFKIAYVLIDNYMNGQTMEISYEEPRLFGTNFFPGKIRIWLDSPETEIILNIETERIEVDIDQRYPFKIPSNYERMK